MANTERISRHKSAIRLGLLIFGAFQVAEGLWQLGAPADWFRDFPYPDANWSALFGGYSEHNVRDLGAAMTAIGFLLLVAAASMRRALVQTALATYIVLQLPHAIFHFANDYRLPDAGQALNGLAVALSVIVPLVLLALSRQPAMGRSGRAPQPARPLPPEPENGAPARIAPARRGIVRRALAWYARRRYGDELTPLSLYAHSPGLALGYGAFEMAFERTGQVDERLKTLAELKAGAMVNCEWCMDFGSKLAAERGVDEEQLIELPRFRESPAFTSREKLVLEYATAISKTPAPIDDAILERLRAEFDDEQILELATAAAIENYRARVNNALGVQAQGFAEGAVCVRPEGAGAAGEAAIAADQPGTVARVTSPASRSDGQ